MTPERWKQISLIYGGGLRRAAGERVAFLTKVCAGDTSLQRDVQALLDQPTSPRGLEGLTPSAIARAMGDDAAAGLTGRRFGVYLVHERIGVGGMGEVYRARDTRLGRDVAIKVLPPAFANDADRLARFEREARVLASLDHPHIGTIHGVEESNPSTCRTTVDAVGQRVIPPRVAFNRLGAVQAPECHRDSPLTALRRGSHSVQPILREHSRRFDVRRGEANHRSNRHAVLRRDRRHRTSRTSGREWLNPPTPANRLPTAPTFWRP